MRIQCPNCHHGLEIVPDVSSTEVRCPSCGSQLDLSSSAETVTYRADSRRTIGHFELLEQVGRWPLCTATHDPEDEPAEHELRVSPDLGEDPHWVCEEVGVVVAPVGALDR